MKPNEKPVSEERRSPFARRYSINLIAKGYRFAPTPTIFALIRFKFDDRFDAYTFHFAPRSKRIRTKRNLPRNNFQEVVIYNRGRIETGTWNDDRGVTCQTCLFSLTFGWLVQFMDPDNGRRTKLTSASFLTKRKKPFCEKPPLAIEEGTVHR